MFLFATLVFLMLAAWLLINGLNEKRWVEDHSHDELVAQDKGFFPDLSRVFPNKEADGSSLVEQTGDKLKSTAGEIKNRSASLSKNLQQRAADENDTLGTLVAKTRSGTHKAVEAGGEWSQKIAQKSGELGKKAAEASGPMRSKMTEEGTPILEKITAKSRELGEKVVKSSGPKLDKIVEQSKPAMQKLTAKGNEIGHKVIEASGPIKDKIIEKGNSAKQTLAAKIDQKKADDSTITGDQNSVNKI